MYVLSCEVVWHTAVLDCAAGGGIRGVDNVLVQVNTGGKQSGRYSTAQKNDMKDVSSQRDFPPFESQVEERGKNEC